MTKFSDKQIIRAYTNAIATFTEFEPFKVRWAKFYEAPKFVFNGTMAIEEGCFGYCLPPSFGKGKFELAQYEVGIQNHWPIDGDTDKKIATFELLDTMAHEIYHLKQMLLDGTKPNHGPRFKAFMKKAHTAIKMGVYTL